MLWPCRCPDGAGGADPSGEASPVVIGYAPHAGPVYALACSPFHRNLFLSASTDGSVQLYNQLQVGVTPPATPIQPQHSQPRPTAATI